MNLEQLIDDKMELLSTEGDEGSNLIRSIEDQFVIFFDYLQDGYEDDLNDAEFEMLLFPLVIILACLLEIHPDLEFDPEKYIDEEEKAFKELEGQNSRDGFSFPSDYAYTDLVYFIEDYLEGLDEEGIGRVIQNIIFVVSVSLLKSL